MRKRAACLAVFAVHEEHPAIGRAGDVDHLPAGRLDVQCRAIPGVAVAAAEFGHGLRILGGKPAAVVEFGAGLREIARRADILERYGEITLIIVAIVRDQAQTVLVQHPGRALLALPGGYALGGYVVHAVNAADQSFSHAGQRQTDAAIDAVHAQRGDNQRLAVQHNRFADRRAVRCGGQREIDRLAGRGIRERHIDGTRVLAPERERGGGGEEMAARALHAQSAGQVETLDRPANLAGGDGHIDRTLILLPVGDHHLFLAVIDKEREYGVARAAHGGDKAVHVAGKRGHIRAGQRLGAGGEAGKVALEEIVLGREGAVVQYGRAGAVERGHEVEIRADRLAVPVAEVRSAADDEHGQSARAAGQHLKAAVERAFVVIGRAFAAAPPVERGDPVFGDEERLVGLKRAGALEHAQSVAAGIDA